MILPFPITRERRQEQPIEEIPLVSRLNTPVEFMEHCPSKICKLTEQRFVADRECADGLIGKCAACGDERIAHFTRTTTNPTRERLQ